jgi:hypothetical protein
LLLHSATVHRGLPNQSDLLRISCDYRYSPVSGTVVHDSIEPHLHMMEWEELYRDWKSDRYQYYWRDLGLNLVDFDRDLNLPE